MENDNARNGLVRGRCLFCGSAFFSERSSAQYCKAACKQKMYRWRSNLRNKEQKALGLVNDIASYLVYDLSTPRAVGALAEISRRISEVLTDHNVKVVR